MFTTFEFRIIVSKILAFCEIKLILFTAIIRGF